MTQNDGIADTFLVIGTDTVFYRYDIQSNNSYNHRPVVQFRVMKKNNYRFVLSVAADSMDFHAWNLAHIATNYGKT